MKYVKVTLFTLFFAITLLINISALNISEVQADLDTESIYDSIPEDIKSTISEDFFDKSDIINSADNINSDKIINYIFNSFKQVIKPTVNSFIYLVSSIIIISLINTSKNTISSKSLAKCVTFITTIILALIIYNTIKLTTNYVINFLSSIDKLINSLLPIMTLIYTIGGNTATAVINSAGLSFTITLINYVIQHIISPVINVCFGLVFAEKLGSLTGIGNITKTIKNVVIFMLTSILTLFSVFLLFKTNLAIAADGVAARTIKFAGSFVPIIGGPLGESVRTLMSGLSLIKSSTGFIGIIIVILITVPTFLRILITKFSFDISSNIAFILGAKKEGEFLKDVSSIYNFLLAVVFSVIVLFIFELIIFVTISPALGK